MRPTIYVLSALFVIFVGYTGGYINKSNEKNIYFGFLLVLGLVFMSGFLQPTPHIATFSETPSFQTGFSTGTIDSTPVKWHRPQEHLIEIIDYEFRPQFVHLLPGDTVQWVNRDTVPHVIHSYTDLFQSQALQQGGTYSRKFEEHGVFNYMCDKHPYTSGSVSVGIAGIRHSGHDLMKARA